MRVFFLVGLLVVPCLAAATDETPLVPPRVATVVLCESTPVDPAYARAIAEGYARILDPNAAPAKCVSADPDRRELPPAGFDALLVITFRKTDLEKPVFSGDLEHSTAKGRRGRGGFAAQGRMIENEDHVPTERLALESVILPLAFSLHLIPDPFPNSPPEDLPPYDATMDLPLPPQTN
jgi:hypothetical protein